MTDINKLYELAVDTTAHKKIVMDNSLLLAKHLMQNDRICDAIDLLKRGASHDNSKFDSEEFENLARILNDTECFTDAERTLSKEEKEAISYHWKHNRHHPEYFEDYSEMTELDMMEMVCDWFARSLQYHTEFIPFVKERQNNRFRFEQSQFDKILKYCELLQHLHEMETIECEWDMK